ncbi:glycosyltransferase family 2 protein [soil metagenome]
MSSPSNLTVIVCTRERPTLLAGALDSIRASMSSHVQVLVVDSGSSTSATRDVARAARVEYVRLEIGGLSIARNAGIAAAATDYVLFTDDDCRPVAGWTDAIVAGFDDPAVGAVTGRMLDHSEIGSDAPYERKWQMSRVLDGLDGGHGALMAFDRRLLVALGGFDDVLGAGRRFGGAEDLDMFCRVLGAGRTIVHTPKSVIHHVNTREGDEYTELHYRYGLGLGAMTNKWIRTRPATGIAMFAVLTKRTLGRLWRDRSVERLSRADRAMMRGILRGLFAASALRVSNQRFVDRDGIAAATPAGSTNLTT